MLSFLDKVARIRAELLGAPSDMPAAQVVATASTADGASGARGAGRSGVVHVVYAGAPKDLLGIFLAPLEPKPCPYS